MVALESEEGAWEVRMLSRPAEERSQGGRGKGKVSFLASDYHDAVWLSKRKRL